MPLQLVDVRATIAQAVSDAGMAVTADPDKVSGPTARVVIGPVTEIERTAACVYEVTVSVWLVARAPADDKALTALELALPTLLETLPPDSTAVFGSYSWADSQLPAYSFDTRLTVNA